MKTFELFKKHWFSVRFTFHGRERSFPKLINKTRILGTFINLPFLTIEF